MNVSATSHLPLFFPLPCTVTCDWQFTTALSISNLMLKTFSTKVNHVLYVCLCLLPLTKLNANYRTTPGISLTGGDSSFKDIFRQPDRLQCTAAFMQSSEGCDWQGDNYCWEGSCNKSCVREVYLYYAILVELLSNYPRATLLCCCGFFFKLFTSLQTQALDLSLPSRLKL